MYRTYQREGCSQKSTDASSLSAMLRPKGTVGRHNDKYEQEAQRLAGQIVRMPGSPTDTRPAGSFPNQVAGQRAYAEPAATGHSGQPLPRSERTFFESRMGYDLSHVRVHTDAVAEGSARSLNARAYTVGHHIVFGQGQLSPHTSDGRHLLAHELTHVVQQTGVARQFTYPNPLSVLNAPQMVSRSMDELPESTSTIGATPASLAAAPAPSGGAAARQSIPRGCVGPNGAIYFPITAAGIASGYTCLRPGARVGLFNNDNVPHAVLVTPPYLLYPYRMTIPAGGTARLTTPAAYPSRIRSGSIVDRPTGTVHDISVYP